MKGKEKGGEECVPCFCLLRYRENINIPPTRTVMYANGTQMDVILARDSFLERCLTLTAVKGIEGKGKPL
jgi:hypothetical protein